MARQNTSIRFNRIYIIAAGLVLFWIMLEARLYYIQLHMHDFYVQQSRLQSAKRIELEARRGNIFDRNGECLATSLIHYDLGVDLSEIRNRQKVAASFSRQFRQPSTHYLKRMQSDRDFVFLARKVSEADMQFINGLEDPGLVTLASYRRYYPFGKYAAQILGFTDVDDRGISGLEMQYESALKGTGGWTFLLADARRRFGYNVDYPSLDPVPGADIHLTLDKNLQTIVEDELDAGLKEYNADAAMAVLMDPNTGEVLAMYSAPGFNPNDPSRAPEVNRRNRIITDILEPGSTFKIFPAAALLQENLKKSDDIVYCENGKYRIYNHTIHDTKKYGWLSFRRVVEKSSNIGMAKLTAELSNNVIYRYIKNFGFDSHTGVDLIGESSGILPKPKEFSGLTKAVLSYGHEIGVTALQITAAYAAVVNGGELKRPTLVRRIKDDKGQDEISHEPFVIRRVIDESVADQLKSFMLDVVEQGTGVKARVPGYRVGGKTGTAQKIDPETRRYVRSSFISSFIGFAPYENPQYVLAVFLDDPKPRYYGGDVAAPIFAAILKKILNFAPLQREEMPLNIRMADYHRDIPDLVGLPATAVEDFFAFREVDFSLSGHGTHVLMQDRAEEDISLKLGMITVNHNRMPDLRGLSIREALKRLDFSRIRAVVEGSGTVRDQSIAPGSVLRDRAYLVLTCAE